MKLDLEYLKDAVEDRISQLESTNPPYTIPYSACHEILFIIDNAIARKTRDEESEERFITNLDNQFQGEI